MAIPGWHCVTAMLITNSIGTIQRVTGALGYYVIADGGDCVQPLDCTNNQDVIVGSCANDKARWTSGGGGMLYNVGCYESAPLGTPAIGVIAGTTCGIDNDLFTATATGAPKLTILFLSACATASINGFG
jgi:hypothetical protein